MFAKSALLASATLALLVSAHPVDKRQDDGPKLPDIIFSCTVPNTVAFTWDDGPWVYTKWIVDQLDAVNATGTFFFNGDLNDCIYDAYEIEAVQYAFDHGHLVASHGWTHRDLALLSDNEVHEELWKVEQALQRIVGVTPRFMRPPYKNYTDATRKITESRGQKIVVWDVDTEDSLGVPVERSKQLYEEAFAKHPSTMMPRNNQGYDTTVHELFPWALKKLIDAKYNLVSLAECLGVEPYAKVGPRGIPDATWHC